MTMRHAVKERCGALSFTGWAAGTRPPTCSQEKSEALAAPSMRAGAKRADILDRISLGSSGTYE